MVVEETSKPKYKADLSIAQEVDLMERMSKKHWSLESAGDKSSCAVPMMLYRDVFKSNSECSSVNTDQKFSTSMLQRCLPSDSNLGNKDSEYSRSSSTDTLTSSWENALVVANGSNKTVVPDLEVERTKSNAGDQPSEKAGDVEDSHSLYCTPADQHGAENKQKQQKDFVLCSVSPLETSSGISIASGESDSTTSSMESRRMFYLDPEKLPSKNSGSDSATSSCALSVANFNVSCENITPGLISTAYSRLKDRDMLYRKRIKELEKEVKKVPVLEMKLATLREENRLLLLQLKFCSGKSRSSGVSEAFLCSGRRCESSNSDTKHSNSRKKSPELFTCSTGSSDLYEVCKTESPKCRRKCETKCNGSGKKFTSHRSETSKSVSPEVTHSRHEPTKLCEAKTNSELEGEENAKCQVPTLVDLSAVFSSLKFDKEDKPTPKFCLKCPRCSFRISEESLEMNLRKDQNVQTDHSVFTFEKSTQTLNDEALKSHLFEYFFQRIEKAFSGSGMNNSESPKSDQIPSILKCAAHFLTDDSRPSCNSTSGCCQLSAKLRDLFGFESSDANTSEASTPSVEADSARFYTVKEPCLSLTRGQKGEVLDSCSDKTSKDGSDLRDKKTKICSLKIQDAYKIEVKNNESVTTAATDQVLTHLLYRSPQKARTDCRSAMLNSVPVRPFLPSQEECKEAFIGENDRQASCPSQISDFTDYDPESGRTENMKSEIIPSTENETTRPKQACDSSDSSCNNEMQVITATGDNSKNNEPDCSENHITLEEIKKSLPKDPNYVTEESEKRCRSPPLRSSNDSEMTNKMQKSQSQIFEVGDIKEELYFPDEVKDAYKRISDYLLNRKNLDGHSLQGPVGLVKKHWFGVMCSPHASPVLLQKYLNEISQHSAILPKWVINLHDASGNTVLHFTVANKRLTMLDALLQTGICDVNKRNKAGFTSVMLASAKKCQNDLDRQLMRKLLQMSDVNAKSYLNGETALILASGHGVEDMVELLTEAGADVNIQDNDGSTPLMYAAEQGFVDIARLLLAHPNCDLSVKDNDGMDACCVALTAGFPNIGLLIYFHAFGKRHTSKKKLGKCKKWLKTSAKNSNPPS